MEAYEIPVKEKCGDRGGLLSVYFVHLGLQMFPAGEVFVSLHDLSFI